MRKVALALALLAACSADDGTGAQDPGGDATGKADGPGGAAVAVGGYVWDGAGVLADGDIFILQLDASHMFFRQRKCGGCDPDVGTYAIGGGAMRFYDLDGAYLDSYTASYNAAEQSLRLNQVTLRRNQEEIAGAWTGGGWGDVDLAGDGTGSYSGTLSGVLGSIRYQRTGDRAFTGTWYESSDRRGTLGFTVSGDGSGVTGSWRADGSKDGGTFRWTRR
jgi:hypothetical protein